MCNFKSMLTTSPNWRTKRAIRQYFSFYCTKSQKEIDCCLRMWFRVFLWTNNNECQPEPVSHTYPFFFINWIQFIRITRLRFRNFFKNHIEVQSFDPHKKFFNIFRFQDYGIYPFLQSQFLQKPWMCFDRSKWTKNTILFLFRSSAWRTNLHLPKRLIVCPIHILKTLY